MSKESQTLEASVRLDDIFDGLGYSEKDRQRFTALLVDEVNKGFPVPSRPADPCSKNTPQKMPSAE